MDKLIERAAGNMTATEVRAAEKSWAAEQSAKRASQPDPLEPVFDRMLDILKENGFVTSDAG